MIRTYQDFYLTFKDVKLEQTGAQRFSLQLNHTLLGKDLTESRIFQKGLTKQIRQLDRRRLDVNEIIEIGVSLGNILLGGKIGEYIERYVKEDLNPEEGIRLRLQLPPELAPYPWEYIYRQRGEGEKDSTGFLCLDPRISITRQETHVSSREFDMTPKPRRLLAAFASPNDEDKLDLAKEKEDLLKAFENSTTNIDLVFLEDASIDGIRKELQNFIEILHFAGMAHSRGKGKVQFLGLSKGKEKFFW